MHWFGFVLLLARLTFLNDRRIFWDTVTDITHSTRAMITVVLSSSTRSYCFTLSLLLFCVKQDTTCYGGTIELTLDRIKQARHYLPATRSSDI